MDIAAPKTKAEAQELCERFSSVAGKIAAQEAKRDAEIAKVNAKADLVLERLLADRGALEQAIEPWFFENRADMLEGKRKSFELGGCLMGARKGKDTLHVPGDAEELAKKLKKLPWAKDYVRVKVSLDVPAVTKGLDDKTDRPKLKRYGFKVVEGEDTFFINRTEQGGTGAKIA